jgi:uncharacterized protein
MYSGLAFGLSTCALRIACALAAALLAIAPAAAQDRGERIEAPPLWKVQGPKGNVFLYGSLHLLPPDVKWRTPAVDGALAESRVVVVETDLDAAQNPQVMQALLAKNGLLPQGQTLSGVLPAKVSADFERTASRLGLPPAAFAPMRPWLAAVSLVMHFFMQMGFDPAHGVDQQIVTWAKANGRTLTALEPLEAQLEIFAGLGREQEAEMLAATLKQVNEMPEMIGAMLDAYRKGNLAALEKMVNIGLDDFPALRRRLLKDRHDKWLPQVEKMIADGRTHFVVVGVAHLVGHDSIVAMLRAKGVKVEGP